MNGEKMNSWGKTKLILEVLAIVGAALFAIFTWGIDSWRLSSPNWAVSFGEFSEYTAVVENNSVRVCSDATCKEASACVIQSKVITENKAKTPLEVGNTKIHFYAYKKEKADGFVNQSSFKVFDNLCSSEDEDPSCPILLGEVNIGSIDDQPLYPTHQSWRPFSIEIVPEKLDGNPSLEEFSINSGVLIIASQQVKPATLFSGQAEITSKATMVLHNMCLKANYKASAALKR